MQSNQPIPPSAPATIPNAPPLTEPTSIGNFSQAVGSLGTQEGGRLAAIVAPYVIASAVGRIIIIDVAAGAWDLGYVPWILDKIGVVKYSGKI